jgi:hypothetical protein
MRIKVLIQGSIVDFSIVVEIWFLCLRGDSSIYANISQWEAMRPKELVSCHDELLQKPSWNDYENATHNNVHQHKVNYVTSKLRSLSFISQKQHCECGSYQKKKHCEYVGQICSNF